MLKMRTSQVTHVGEDSSTPSNVRQLSRDSVKNDRRDAKAEGAANWPAAIPSSSLRVGSVRLGSPCPVARDRTTGETNYCIEKVTSKDMLDHSAHCLRKDGTS